MARGKDTILVSKEEWKLFLQTVTALVKAQNRLLERSRKLRIRHPRLEQKKRQGPQWGVCADCGRNIARNAKFCDRCGLEVAT